MSRADGTSILVVPTYQTEIGVLHDIDGDGKPELVYGAEGQMRYAKPDPANPTATWKIHNVSERGYVTAHGVGAGDINGDGRADIVNPYGWWEQPPAGSNKEPWALSPAGLRPLQPRLRRQRDGGLRRERRQAE